MEAIYSSEMSVNFQWNTRHCISEDTTFHNHRCEDLQSYIRQFVVLKHSIGTSGIQINMAKVLNIYIFQVREEVLRLRC
jgi:hypothetical protein